MFRQMCDTVAACHAQQVFHRDIKPEIFIVTDGTSTTPDGRLECKVIVKLTDFGLLTTDLYANVHYNTTLRKKRILRQYERVCRSSISVTK
ncbi:hypothetical protein CVT26_011564 [Gymnopilus dilepis]|uniref:Protein kinase domain-containing protein n=1 Tax=Gymnopilus dilepis TaxID=231916 RepID=A0A409WWX9_9AGAR|nr:hypothetical protein CVT26_011564 [Gymnopilus dilepis]